jgi:hypothetical protein
MSSRISLLFLLDTNQHCLVKDILMSSIDIDISISSKLHVLNESIRFYRLFVIQAKDQTTKTVNRYVHRVLFALYLADPISATFIVSSAQFQQNNVC